MRTMTTINWVRGLLTGPAGARRGTVHTGSRGSWTFRITTTNGTFTLTAVHEDGRTVNQEHRSLRAAKDAALNLLHPSEAMRWGAGVGDGMTLYRAQWDSLIFVVFATVADGLAFQWRDADTDFRSEAVQVSGIREARQLAAAVLRDRSPEESPAAVPQAGDGPREALASALEAAGISFTDEQLSFAATALVVQRARP